MGMIKKSPKSVRKPREKEGNETKNPQKGRTEC